MFSLSFVNCWFPPQSCINQYWQSLHYQITPAGLCWVHCNIELEPWKGKKQPCCWEIGVIVNHSVSLSHVRNAATAGTLITRVILDAHFGRLIWIERVHDSSVAPQLIYLTNNSFGNLESLISCQSRPLFIVALICCYIYLFHLLCSLSAFMVYPCLSYDPCISFSFTFLCVMLSSPLVCSDPPPPTHPPTYLPTHPPIPSLLGWFVASSVEVSPSLPLVDPGECSQLFTFITCNFKFRMLNVNVTIF